jgi:LysR family transcriptional activator of glutamate synthase operon
MEFREILSFTLLAKSRSILETSRELCLTPGAVHKHLKTLEAELGIPLYEKHDGTLRLTASGKVALPYFQDILDRRDAAIEAAVGWKGQATGVVRIGAGPSFSSYMLPRILSRFRRRYPKVEIFVETGTGGHLRESLRSGSLDLIFDVANPPVDPAEFTTMAEWESFLCIVSARPDLPHNCPMSKLKNVPFILFPKDTPMQNMIDAHFDRIGFRPRVVMRSDSAEAIKAMVKSRLGVAMLFLYNANQDVRDKSIRVIRVERSLSARMVLLKRRSTFTPRPSLAFAQLAQQMRWANLHPIASPGTPEGRS